MMWFSNNRHLEEDRQLYARAEAILSEEGMEEFLGELKNDKSFRQELRSRVMAYLACCEEDAPNYRSRRLQEKAKALTAALKELKIHTATHFLVFPRNQSGPDLRHALHPDYFILEMTNVSIDEHNFYFKAEKDLLQLVEKTGAAYCAFRQAVAGKKVTPCVPASAP